MAVLLKLLIPLLMEGVKLYLEERKKSRKGEVSKGKEEMVDELSDRLKKKHGKAYQDALRRADSADPGFVRRDSGDNRS